MNSLVTVQYPDLHGKVAVVTGGSRGIGAQTARALAAQGVRVAVNGRDEAAVNATVRAIQAAQGEALAVPGDCARLADMEALRDQVLATLGRPRFRGRLCRRRQQPTHALRADQRGRLALQHRQQPHRHLSDPESAAAGHEGARPGRHRHDGLGRWAGGRVAAGAPAAYGTAKAGIIMLTRHLAQEMGRHGIRVNAVSPSAVLTERTRASITPERESQMLPAFPLGRLGVPQDVADATLFLLSGASSWITGVTLDVAGGRVMS